MTKWERFVEWWSEISAPRRAFRRWLFRRMFPGYTIHDAFTRPNDGQEVILLDASNRKNPIWVAQYDATHECYNAGGGWFEASEIDYYVPTQAAYPTDFTKGKP